MLGREKNNTDDIPPGYEIPSDEDGITTHMMYDDAQKLETPFLIAALRLYGEWNCFKILPHGKGTMDERQTVIDIIRILTQEENRYTNWEMDRDRKDIEE